MSILGKQIALITPNPSFYHQLSPHLLLITLSTEDSCSTSVTRRVVVVQGNVIVTASWVQLDALQLWDYRKGALLKNLAYDVKERGGGHVQTSVGDVLMHGGGAYLYCCQFCTSNVVIAGGTGTNSTQAVSIDNSEV